MLKCIARGATMVLTVGVLAAVAANHITPKLTFHTSGGSSTYELSRVNSLSFNGDASSIHKVRNEFCGLRFVGASSGMANFVATGTPGTMASMQLLNVQGRVLWSGTSRLDATGLANFVASVPSGGLLIARYRNESFSKSTPVPMLGSSR